MNNLVINEYFNNTQIEINEIAYLKKCIKSKDEEIKELKNKLKNKLK